MEKKLYPMQLKGALKDYIWGGQKLKSVFKKQTPLEQVAESWEVSDRKEGESIIENGLYQGHSLKEVVKLLGKDLIGRRSKEFPLLIKLIDANDTLSVQVHPDDAKAKQLQAQPKNEGWVILDALPKSALFLGVLEGVDKDQIGKAIGQGYLENILRKCNVKKHEAVFVKAGTLHAIGKGCLILEVQQNSNTTYRVYDWGRKGKDGQPRPLHIDESMECLDIESRPILQKPEKIEQIEENERYLVLETPYFIIEKWVVKDEVEIPHSSHSFEVFFTLEGQGTLIAGELVPMEFGKTILVPAKIKKIRLKAKSHLAVFRIYLP
jgi:mannose-6-phosphate isomerase